MIPDTFLHKLFDVLNKKYCYAVLRNHESLPQSLGSRDIDILLASHQFRSFQNDCAELAVVNGFKLLYVHRDEQFWSVVLGSVEDGPPKLIQLDVMLNLNVMGVIFLDERKVLAERLFNGKIYHLPLKYIFLSKFIYSRVLNSPYPEKYRHIESEIRRTSADEIDLVLGFLLNNPSATLDYWQKHSGRILFLQGLLASLRRQPIRQLYRLVLFLAWNLRHRLGRRGLLISLSGPDGSGKTTVIAKVIEVFSMVNPPKRFHFRPNLLPNLGEVGLKVKVIEKVDRRYDVPHRAKRNGIINSQIRLMYYMLDYILGYFSRILPMLYRKHVVIFDRYFADMVVDGERSGVFLNYKYLASLRHFIPGCHYNFLIRVEPDRILARKQELTRDAIDRIYFRLEYLAARDKSYYWVENNGEPGDAVTKIFATLLNRQHQILFPKFNAR